MLVCCCVVFSWVWTF